MDKMRDSLEATKRYDLKDVRDKNEKLKIKFTRQSRTLQRMTSALIHAERLLQKIIIDHNLELTERIGRFSDIFAPQDGEDNDLSLEQLVAMQQQIGSFNQRLIDAKHETATVLERGRMIEDANKKLKHNYRRLMVSRERF